MFLVKWLRLLVTKLQYTWASRFIFRWPSEWVSSRWLGVFRFLVSDRRWIKWVVWRSSFEWHPETTSSNFRHSWLPIMLLKVHFCVLGLGKWIIVWSVSIVISRHLSSKFSRWVWAHWGSQFWVSEWNLVHGFLTKVDLLLDTWAWRLSFLIEYLGSQG